MDTGIADSEASRLHEAIETKQYDHDHVVWILSTRNIFQLRATFECYKQKYGHSIDQVFITSTSAPFTSQNTCVLFNPLFFRSELGTFLDRTLRVVAMENWNLS